MIEANEKARLHCDERGCTESIRVGLVLMPTGGWGVHFPASAVNRWQLLGDKNNPMSPFQGRCPAHNKSRLVTPKPGLVALS